MAISHEDALQILNASIDKAKELGVAVGISIVDANGQPVASIRMSDVQFQWLSEVSAGKALATVYWRGTPSGELAERAGNPLFAWVKEHYNQRLVYAKGAVAIKQGGAVIGAVGVGGASQEQDEEIARAGASVLSDE